MDFMIATFEKWSSFRWQDHLNWLAAAGLIAGFASLLGLLYTAIAIYLARRIPKEEPQNLMEMLSKREKNISQNSLRHLSPLLVSQIELKTDAKIE